MAECHQEGGLHCRPRAHGHAPGTVPPPPRVLSPRAEATRRLSKHNKLSKRAQEPGGRL